MGCGVRGECLDCEPRRRCRGRERVRGGEMGLSCGVRNRRFCLWSAGDTGLRMGHRDKNNTPGGQNLPISTHLPLLPPHLGIPSPTNPGHSRLGSPRNDPSSGQNRTRILGDLTCPLRDLYQGKGHVYNERDRLSYQGPHLPRPPYDKVTEGHWF